MKIDLNWHENMTRQEVVDNLGKLNGQPKEILDTAFLYAIINILLDIKDSLKK